jgi:uncharacterized Ntn-hydrolase superfamily protein
VTFSIVGADLVNGDWGVAVASKFPAVGAVVPWARAGIGAVATQSWANTTYGPEGLALMGSGVPAHDAMARLVDADEHKDERQAGFVDGRGRSATFTGAGCSDWAGGVTGEHFAAQGNILVGPGVVDAMAASFVATEGDLCDRLLAALVAGDRAGGDRRGRQSAALLVVREHGGYEGGNDRYTDLRVDDHADAVTEMVRLFGIWDDTMLVRNDPLLDASPELVGDIQRRLSALGRFRADPSGDFDAATRSALAEFAGVYNLEGRLREDDRISQLLVREIRDLTPELDD